MAGCAVPVSCPPRASRAGEVVAPHGSRATAILAFIQFIGMDQAVRAGQRDADSSSAVQGRFDRAWPMPAPAGLDRTPVGRIIRKTFVDSSGRRHATWLQCRPVVA
ncbi:hypothetical protein DPR02_09860 [Burkholderia cepacia]|uniref:Uncharacterized protein n=1 Tax=Burkholderia cepacia TaxID=292 RepID=A0AAQ0JL22_BURCE|nr:hypothetical protein DPR02_09860 [Burkholderia cepacia]